MKIQADIAKTVNTVRKEFQEYKEQEIKMLEIETKQNSYGVAKITGESIKEFQEREDRKLHIALLNVPESASGIPEYRKRHDYGYVRKVCNSILKNTVQCNKTFRIGKRPEDETYRPLLATVASTQQASEILKSAKKLSKVEDQTMENIIIKRDLSPLKKLETKQLLTVSDQKRVESQTKGRMQIG